MKGLLFTYVLAYGGAVVALFRPWYGFLIYMTFGILRPEGLWSYSFGDEGGRSFSLILAIAVLAGWALNGGGSWKFGRARASAFALLGFLLWSLLSAIQARFDSEAALTSVLESAKVILPIVIGLSLINSVQQLRQLAWVLILCNGYLAWRFNEEYYTHPEFIAEEWHFASLDNNGIALTMVASTGAALFMALGVSKWWQRIACLFAAVLMIHVVLFSMSRGGMLALICTGVVAFLIVPKRPVTLGLFLAAVLIGLRLAGPMVVERFSTTLTEQKDGSVISRQELWGQCWQLMLHYPVFGIGPDNWFKYAPQHWGHEKAAHTLWLQVGAETGFVGLGLLVLFYGACVARLLRYTREKTPVRDPWLRSAARMVVASVVGFVIAAQFLSVQGVELPYYIVLLGVGVLKLESLQASTVPAGAWAPLAQYPPSRPMPMPPAPAPYPHPVRS